MYWTYLRPTPVELQYTFLFMRKKIDIHYLLCDRENLNKEKELLESPDLTRAIFLTCNVEPIGTVIFEVNESYMLVLPGQREIFTQQQCFFL